MAIKVCLEDVLKERGMIFVTKTLYHETTVPG